MALAQTPAAERTRATDPSIATAAGLPAVGRPRAADSTASPPPEGTSRQLPWSPAASFGSWNAPRYPSYGPPFYDPRYGPGPSYGNPFDPRYGPPATDNDNDADADQENDATVPSQQQPPPWQQNPFAPRPWQQPPPWQQQNPFAAPRPWQQPPPWQQSPWRSPTYGAPPSTGEQSAPEGRAVEQDADQPLSYPTQYPWDPMQYRRDPRPFPPQQPSFAGPRFDPFGAPFGGLEEQRRYQMQRPVMDALVRQRFLENLASTPGAPTLAIGSCAFHAVPRRFELTFCVLCSEWAAGVGDAPGSGTGATAAAPTRWHRERRSRKGKCAPFHTFSAHSANLAEPAVWTTTETRCARLFCPFVLSLCPSHIVFCSRSFCEFASACFATRILEVLCTSFALRCLYSCEPICAHPFLHELMSLAGCPRGRLFSSFTVSLLFSLCKSRSRLRSNSACPFDNRRSSTKQPTSHRPRPSLSRKQRTSRSMRRHRRCRSPASPWSPRKNGPGWLNSTSKRILSSSTFRRLLLRPSRGCRLSSGHSGPSSTVSARKSSRSSVAKQVHQCAHSGSSSYHHLPCMQRANVSKSSRNRTSSFASSVKPNSADRKTFAKPNSADRRTCNWPTGARRASRSQTMKASHLPKYVRRRTGTRRAPASGDRVRNRSLSARAQSPYYSSMILLFPVNVMRTAPAL